VNLACWLLGDEVAEVSARRTGGHTVFADETTLAVLGFRGGVLGHFAASYATDLWSFGLLGTRARVHLLPGHVVLKGTEPWEGDFLRYGAPGEEACLPTKDLAPVTGERADAMEVHGLFARWLRGGEPYPAPGEVGLRDLRVVEAVDRSVEEGMLVSLD
jgi:predicted dehydrogenase